MNLAKNIFKSITLFVCMLRVFESLSKSQVLHFCCLMLLVVRRQVGARKITFLIISCTNRHFAGRMQIFCYSAHDLVTRSELSFKNRIVLGQQTCLCTQLKLFKQRIPTLKRSFLEDGFIQKNYRIGSVT
jgi:hypothetical protein